MTATPQARPVVWHCDFEFGVNDDGSPQVPFLLAALEHTSGQVIVRWGDDLTSRSAPPFPLTDHTFVVSHFCQAEAECFRLLGWPRPRFIDTLIEFRLHPAYANWRDEVAFLSRFKDLFKDDPRKQPPLKLNDMVRSLGFTPLYSDAEKQAFQQLASKGPPDDEDQKQRLINYGCGRNLM
jgi:hypothetical protein